MKILQFFFCHGRYKLKHLFIVLLPLFLVVYVFDHQNLLKTVIKISKISRSPSSPTDIRTHDFRLYPESRSFIEYRRIQIGNIAQSMFTFNRSKNEQGIYNYSQPIKYSEVQYRSASIPIIWLDTYGDVRWNRAAQYEALSYLMEKQFPYDNISTCLTRQLFILAQSPSGFYSRHHCFIEQFGQALYSPSMALLAPKRFHVKHSSKEDF